MKTETASITWANILASLADPLIWMHCALNVLGLAPKGGLQLYGPTIIKANLLNSVSSFGVIVLSFAISLASDKTRLRGPWCIVCFVYSIAFAGALYGIDNGKATKWTLYAIFIRLSAGNALAQGLNDAWVNINATTAVSRSIGFAGWQRRISSVFIKRQPKICPVIPGYSFVICGLCPGNTGHHVDVLEEEKVRQSGR